VKQEEISGAIPVEIFGGILNCEISGDPRAWGFVGVEEILILIEFEL
jgi:hypothetical protein